MMWEDIDDILNSMEAEVDEIIEQRNNVSKSNNDTNDFVDSLFSYKKELDNMSTEELLQEFNGVLKSHNETLEKYIIPKLD